MKNTIIALAVGASLLVAAAAFAHGPGWGWGGGWGGHMRGGPGYHMYYNDNGQAYRGGPYCGGPGRRLRLLPEPAGLRPLSRLLLGPGYRNGALPQAPQKAPGEQTEPVR